MRHHSGASASRDSIDKRLARKAAERYGVFTRSEAVRLGGSRGLIQSRLRTARWEPLHPGVYRLAGAPESWRQRLLAARLAGGDASAASHRAALALWKLSGSEERVLEISVLRGHRVRLRGVIVHETSCLPLIDIALVDAIRVTSPTRTLIDAAALVDDCVIEEALDDALRRRLTTVSLIRKRLSKLGSQRPGSAVLRRLIAARADAAVPESPLETRFLRLIRRARLPLPACQYEVRDNGRLIARVDFAYPDLRLAIEADGYRWHSGRSQWQRDLGRRNRLTALGWHVIHVTSADLDERPDELVTMIAGVLRGGA